MDILDKEEASEGGLLLGLGQRVKSLRLSRELSQAELGRRAGLSRHQIVRLEGGEPVGILSLLRVAMALGRLHEIAGLFSAPEISPIEIAKMSGRTRQRAYGKKQRQKK